MAVHEPLKYTSHGNKEFRGCAYHMQLEGSNAVLHTIRTQKAIFEAIGGPKKGVKFLGPHGGQDFTWAKCCMPIRAARNIVAGHGKCLTKYMPV